MNPASKLFELVFISGCGDIGLRVARRWRARGIPVHSLTRSDIDSDQANLISHAIVADLDAPATLPVLPLQNALLYHFAPPPEHGETDPRLMHLLNHIAPDSLPKRVVLISTTAVYGDADGAWIDETFAVVPQSARGKRRLHAEQTLRHWAEQHDVDYVILRVPGIYGPGRLPLARIQQGAPVLREDQSPYTNRIHADDLALVCEAAAMQAPGGEVYNVSDGHPGTMTGYFKTIARHFNLPPPPEIDWQQAQQQMSAGMLSYLQESRRISNAKMLRELNVQLQYPDLQSGLDAMVD